MATSSNVDTAIVDGEVIERDGEFRDPEFVALKDEFSQASSRILREAGLAS